MDFTDFQCFIKICQYNSITNAARSIFVSQQALSARMKRLETELGSSLFLRSKKGIILTDYGQKVFALFSPLVNNYENVLSDLKTELTTNSHEVIFSATSFVFDSLGPDIITGFSQKYPQYFLNISELLEDKFPDRFSNSNARFYLVSDADAKQFTGYHSFPITTYHRNLILHKDNPLAKRKSLRFEEIIDESLFALNQRAALESLALEHLAGSGKQLNIVQRGSDPLLFLELINQNKGAMIAAPIFRIQSPFTNIRQVPILDSFLDFRPAFIYKNASDLLKQDKLFITYLLETVKAAVK
ncbi:MAG: LysR family transcriptional regulator [Lachnospiraceae bacterium]|nr:LysR family transcriptional regulator [Lachnospiraceae bacterium]